MPLCSPGDGEPTEPGEGDESDEPLAFDGQRRARRDDPGDLLGIRAAALSHTSDGRWLSTLGGLSGGEVRDDGLRGSVPVTTATWPARLVTEPGGRNAPRRSVAVSSAS